MLISYHLMTKTLKLLACKKLYDLYLQQGSIMEDIKLSKKGKALIKMYEEMAAKGIDRVDASDVYKRQGQTELEKKKSIMIFN